MENKPTQNDLAGMTVNERLACCGLFEEWTKAAKERNKNEMVELLKKVSLTHEDAVESVEKFSSNPAYYGY